jgi:hypothetical protein
VLAEVVAVIAVSSMLAIGKRGRGVAAEPLEDLIKGLLEGRLRFARLAELFY